VTEQKFKHMSVGKDGSVWGAGKKDGTIHRLYGDGGGGNWIADQDGKAELIAAVDRANAWCVNSAHEIWHMTNVQPSATGSTWTKMPTHSGQSDAKTIAVDSNGSPWYAQMDGKIFRQPDPSDGVGLHTHWVEVKGVGQEKTAVMAVSIQDGVWCINDMGNIQLWQNGTWIKIPTHSGRADAKTLSVNTKGRLWYTSTDGEIFVSHIPGDGVSLSRWMHDTSWDRKQMGKADVLAVGPEDLVWCLNTKGEVWHASDDKWQQLGEQGPNGKKWAYKVKRGDGLMAIVRKEFKLKDPRDTQEIGRLVNLIVVQNGIKNRDKIKPGDTLTLHY
jgi:streptogramin lyase